MAFRIALSGLDAAATDLEVTGNNIANASTNGFKESRAEFGDIYANAVNDQSATAPGRGVRVTRVAQQFGQGTVDFTSRNLDLAIAGDGFFVVQNADGSTEYTRAGAFNADRNGLVINHASQRLQVYPAQTVAGVTTFTTGVLQDLQLPLASSAPSATTEVTTAINLDAAGSINAAASFNVNDPSTYNFSTSTTVYDSLGASHTATIYYMKTAVNAGPPATTTWDTRLHIDGTNVTPAAPANQLTFDNAGALSVPAGGTMTYSTFTPPGGAAPMNLTFNVGNMTMYGGGSAVNNLTQNGYATGRLSGLDIDTEGVVFARYTNGQSQALGKVALAKFNNTQGLRPLGDTNWAETFISGTRQLGEAGTSSFGSIQAGALEASNVDVSEQLVNLIIAQRNFQANTKVISTADAITQSIINIR